MAEKVAPPLHGQVRAVGFLVVGQLHAEGGGGVRVEQDLVRVVAPAGDGDLPVAEPEGRMESVGRQFRHLEHRSFPGVGSQ
ncbi:MULTISPECIES: hypothetical protein [Methylobacterium]|uniref:hypothetical protein n=1 Tax=Methylobacterium TaxID=407 RepID=UPI0006844C00|nr:MULTISPECIES: hypothetical protein [Methylobacterium]